MTLYPLLLLFIVWFSWLSYGQTSLKIRLNNRFPRATEGSQVYQEDYPKLERLITGYQRFYE